MNMESCPNELNVISCNGKLNIEFWDDHPN